MENICQWSKQGITYVCYDLNLGYVGSMSGHMSNSKASEVGRTYDWTDADWSPNNVHANRSYINMSHII